MMGIWWEYIADHNSIYIYIARILTVSSSSKYHKLLVSGDIPFVIFRIAAIWNMDITLFIYIYVEWFSDGYIVMIYLSFM